MMVAYRAETALVRALAPGCARAEDEGRALIREMLLTEPHRLPRWNLEPLRLQYRHGFRRLQEAHERLCGIGMLGGCRNPGDERRDELQVRGQGPDQLAALHPGELRHLLDGQVDLSADEERGGQTTRRRELGPGLHLL